MRPHPPERMENRNIPVIPLPNPGEGGPVFPGNDNSGAEPVIPLPNPGEGGPVFPGGGSVPGGGNAPGNRPPVPPAPPSRPNPPPQPTPPSYPGGGIQLLPGSTYPPVSSPYAAVRFLNATSGYAPFRILVDGSVAVRLLDAGSATGYLRVPSGQRTITVAGLDGYVYLQQTLRFPAASASTVAILNRTGGLALRRIADSCVNC